MPWRETGPMEERLALIMDVLVGGLSVAEASLRRNVSCKTAYKYLKRYEEEGGPGLQDRSRRPHHSPHITPAEIRALLIEEKRRKPYFGPKKIVTRLRLRHPDLEIPAPSTVGEILKAAGLVDRNRKRSRRTPAVRPVWERARTEADQPNRVWTIDFKGEFRLGNRALCYPLTVVDLYSRAPRLIHALPSTRGGPVRDVLTPIFARDGLPEVIRSDQGSPFASAGLGGLTHLSLWWLKLGIRIERNDPGHPEQNGAHERMHRTLKAQTTRPPQYDFVSQQHVFDAFLEEYNQERPHEAIGMRYPAELYHGSPRKLPADPPVVRYPGHFEVRTVRPDGYIKWAGRPLYVSETLAAEPVGIENVDHDLWSVYYGPVLLGRFGARSDQLPRGSERQCPPRPKVHGLPPAGGS